VRKQALYILRISLDIFSSSEDNGAQQCSRRRSAALPAQDKSNTAMTKREMNQSDENCSSGKDRWKVFLLLYEMLQEYGTHLVEAAWTHQVSWFLHALSLRPVYLSVNTIYTRNNSHSTAIK
jgi:hypothetical protein